MRGSRHAWDVRLISAEALMKLVFLKENSDQEETGKKIRSVLVPVEYTRVDALVDVVFAAASDVDSELPISSGADHTDPQTSVGPPAASKDKGHINQKREEITRAMAVLLDKPLIKKSRAMWWSADHSSRIACTISKRHDTGHDYWYAFHPSWKEFLEEAKESFFVLGCADLGRAFAIPIGDLVSILPYLNITETERGMYWHVQLDTNPDQSVRLAVPKKARWIPARSATGQANRISTPLPSSDRNAVELTNQVHHRLCPGSPWDRDTATSALRRDAACAA